RATPAPTSIPRENRPKQGSIHSAALRFVRRPTKRNKTSLSSSLKSLSFMVPPVQVVQPLLRTGALLLAALLLAAIESTQRSLRDAHQLVLDQWNRGQADAQSQQARGEPGEEAAAQDVADAGGGSEHQVRMFLNPAAEIERLGQVVHYVPSLVPQLLGAGADVLHPLADRRSVVVRAVS